MENVAESCRKWSNTSPNPEKTEPTASPPAPRLLSGPFSVTGEVILWLRWARRTVAARPEQRSRRIYHWTACQGDYWIKITIWHFSFSVLAQWTEGKLLQPSVPSSTLLIASLAPLQPLREKSFCQNITQSTDFFPPPLDDLLFIWPLRSDVTIIPSQLFTTIIRCTSVCLESLECCRVTRWK